VRILRRKLRQVRKARRAEVLPLRQEGASGHRVRLQGAEPARLALRSRAEDVRQGGDGRGRRGESASTITIARSPATRPRRGSG
jgi:hypothetical protein